MPELPEVETIVRGLKPIEGTVIERVDVLDDRLAVTADDLRGVTIDTVARRGKHIVIRLVDRGDLVVHLRMSGRLCLERTEREAAYTRLVLHLGSGDRVYFINPRRLGTVRLCPDGLDAALGVEPLQPAFTVEALAEMAAASRSAIKPFLLDQRRIAGLGNIYAAEALWRAGIDPRRRADSLEEPETARLHQAIVDVLTEAIDQLGTTLGTSVSDYRPSDAASGEFQNHLAVYARESEPCERCETKIERITQAGRSTYLCPACQQ